MKPAVLVGYALIASWYVAEATADTSCPATTNDDPLFDTSIPGWYGTESFAVLLPSPAVWPTTQPGQPMISGRVFWRSSGFRPGSEANFYASIRSLDGTPVTGRISRATNAHISAVQPDRAFSSAAEKRELVNETIRSPDAWRMLTGVYFPDAGCWEITATYLGQTLTFVVETVNSDRESADILSPVGGFNPTAIVAPKLNDGSTNAPSR